LGKEGITGGLGGHTITAKRRKKMLFNHGKEWIPSLLQAFLITLSKASKKLGS
jgi:hypothetical protein